MSGWPQFIQSQIAHGAKAVDCAGRQIITVYRDPADEYRLATTGPGVVDRSYRALLQVTGKDRASWLHNLTTNHIQTLSVGDGNYAFATNVQGRILFDLNVFVREQCLWVDLDAGFTATARAHFDKYKIIEDVEVTDISVEVLRLGLIGARGADVVASHGAPHARTLPALGSAVISVCGVEIPVVRNDFCGVRGYDLFVPASSAVDVWRCLTESARDAAAFPVGDHAVQVRRIEAGIPWPGREITEDYLPAETGQSERAVSFNKGCYLGQEVVERMRSRNVVARRLVGVRIEGDRLPHAGAVFSHDGRTVGTLTSACKSPACGSVLALGYVKTAASATGTRLTVSWEQESAGAEVVSLPVNGTSTT